jgi:hypothetical protein
MSYNNLAKRKVKQVFKLIGDLAIDVTLAKRSVVDFNFQKVEPKTPTSETVTTKAVMLSSDKESTEQNVMRNNLLLITEEVGDVLTYDTVTILTKVWKIGPIIKSDGFTSTVEIYREVSNG